MYRWIWRHLPTRRRALTAALLAATALWLLWHVVFPATAAHLPLDDTTVRAGAVLSLRSGGAKSDLLRLSSNASSRLATLSSKVRTPDTRVRDDTAGTVTRTRGSRWHTAADRDTDRGEGAYGVEAGSQPAVR
jgi:hypothetical protein